MSRQNNDPLALIPTIDDDDNDVPDLDGQDEDENDEVMEKPRVSKKGKSIDFDEEFQFILDDPEERRIKFNPDDQLKTRGQLSTIDEKIAELRNRKKKVNFITFVLNVCDYRFYLEKYI